MARFAASVTVAQLALSVLTAVLFSLDSPPDPYLTRDDLNGFSLPFTRHETVRQMRFDALLGYDTHATLDRPRQTLWVSVRVDQTEADFQSRRRREESWSRRPNQVSRTTIVDDADEDDQGFAVRQHGPSGARCELVRFKGDRMLVVRLSRSEPLEGAPEEELAACERRARLLQARMLEKLRWSSPAPPRP
jgi:hypothetical protein